MRETAHFRIPYRWGLSHRPSLSILIRRSQKLPPVRTIYFRPLANVFRNAQRRRLRHVAMGSGGIPSNNPRRGGAPRHSGRPRRMSSSFGKRGFNIAFRLSVQQGGEKRACAESRQSRTDDACVVLAPVRLISRSQVAGVGNHFSKVGRYPTFLFF